MADAILADDKKACELLSQIFEHIYEDKSAEDTITKLVAEDIRTEYFDSFSEPYWVHLYLKISSRIPDRIWQQLLNVCQNEEDKESINYEKYYLPLILAYLS